MSCVDTKKNQMHELLPCAQGSSAVLRTIPGPGLYRGNRTEWSAIAATIVNSTWQDSAIDLTGCNAENASLHLSIYLSQIERCKEDNWYYKNNADNWYYKNNEYAGCSSEPRPGLIYNDWFNKIHLISKKQFSGVSKSEIICAN